MRSRDRIGKVLASIVAALGLVACGVSLQPGGTGNGCFGTNCPPPVTAAAASHVFKAHRFSFTYFDPWQVSSQDATGAVVTAGTNYGDLVVQLEGTSVKAGTSAQALLAQATSNLDTSQLSGLQDQGPIYGASIGYISGAGETYSAYADQANGPSVPVFLQIMASVQGGTGLVFVAESALDPSSPDPNDPRQVPAGEYDRMVNSVTWA